MRYIKKCMALLMILVMSFAMGMTAMADEPANTGYETTYTVRILPGDQGSISGETVFTGLHYGDTISFSISQVSVNDPDRYYAKGLKDSGMDHNSPTSDFSNRTYLTTDGSGNFTITVTKDQDFVVSYGLRGSSVSYTINYVDRDGNALRESRTYEGNVGDKPVVSYLYVDQYQPQAYNLTKTLTADSSSNVFTFVYTRIAQPETPSNPDNSNNQESESAQTDESSANGETTADGTSENGASDNSGSQNNGAAGEDAADANASGETTAETVTEAETVIESEAPMEIIDLDDEDTPLGNIDASGNSSSGNTSKTMAGVICGVIVIAAAAFVITRKKRKTNN